MWCPERPCWRLRPPSRRAGGRPAAPKADQAPARGDNSAAFRLEWPPPARHTSATSKKQMPISNPAKLRDYAWFEKSSGGHPRPVGQKQPNPWGLYDICGNVWEWCNDFYKVDYYQESPQQDPRGPNEGQNKVLRGGGWRFSAESCRSGYRYNENPGYSDVCFGYDIYGFRCVRKNAASAKP
ncbi:MAG: formylglycine-generating enzyme family protein [Verrucomicrobia bacterium]|nr:formylglycine-generating enzyme family protein [Verrucomicrobiota bacterium]